MAVTYGFYNSINHDRRYDAIQVGQIFDGIIHDGVYETYKSALLVKASEVANQVIIQPGRAWFNHTWTYNDADLPFTAPAPETVFERIDALVLDVDQSLNKRVNSFKWVTGTPASSPVKPELTRAGDHWQYPLAYVHRYGNQTTIRTDDIENAVGTSLCPFVVGVLEVLEVDDLLAQWTAQFGTYMTTKTTQWNAFQTGMENRISAYEQQMENQFFAWMESQEYDFTTWKEAQQAAFLSWLATQQTTFNSFMTGASTSWTNWFSHVQTELDGDVAGHLQEQIDAISFMYVIDSRLYLPNTGASINGTKLILNNHN